MENPTQAELRSFCTRARELWLVAFGNKKIRMHDNPRSDVGIKRKRDDDDYDQRQVKAKHGKSLGLPCERDFHKRLLSQVAAGSATARQERREDSYDPRATSSWSARHEQEVLFQKRKHASRFVEAHINGLLLPDEQSLNLHQLSKLEIDRRARALNQRHNAAKRVQDLLSSAERTLKGHAVFVAEGASSAALCLKLQALGCRQEREISKATLFLMNNPYCSKSLTTQHIQLIASLKGAVIASPHVYLDSDNVKGPWLQLQAALKMRRFFWASPKFRDDFPKLWLSFLDVLHGAGTGNKWKIIDKGEDFALIKVRYNKAPASCIALMTPAEVRGDERAGIKHVYSPLKFVKFFRRYDAARSSLTCI